MERFDLNSTRLMADSAYGSAPGTGRSRDLTVFCTSGIETTAGKPEKLSSTSRREISGGNIKMVEGPHFQKKPISECTSDERLKGTSNNCHRSSGAPSLPANDSALFSFRFCAVHPTDVRDCQLWQFF